MESDDEMLTSSLSTGEVGGVDGHITNIKVHAAELFCMQVTAVDNYDSGVGMAHCRTSEDRMYLPRRDPLTSSGA